MDHVACLDYKSRELENLLNGAKSMIIRGSSANKLPYDSISEGDILYFINHPGQGVVEAKGSVSCIMISEELSVEESFETIIRHQDKLQLPDKQFDRIAGKKYLVMIGLSDIEQISPFHIEYSNSNSYGDWLAVENIEQAVVEKERIA